MIGTLIGIIFALILIGVLWWAVQQLLGLIPIPDPFRTIIYVLCVVVMVMGGLWIVSVLLGMVGIHIPRFL